MIRTFEQDIVERFAANSRCVPIINGLTNEYHPCQDILADILTFIEHRGSIQGKTVAWIGDSNNICNTGRCAARCWTSRQCVTPPGYEVEPERAGLFGTNHFEQFADPMEACRGADLVTTDVWTSMGFEAENEGAHEGLRRLVRGRRHDVCGAQGRRLHALPARAPRRRGDRRGHRRPAVGGRDEAENRLHAQKALMEYLVLGRIQD